MTSERPCILIVDDEGVNISLLVGMLRQDFELKVAMDGLEALKAAASHPVPDMILLDVQMPQLNGYEVCKQLKADPRTRETPVIFISAMSEETDEQLGLELGAVDYIAKPFRPALVMTRIRNHLELKLQRDYLKRLSALDGLTGIANRRRFDQFFQEEWQRALRAGSPLAVILLDIDHFKTFNDTHGHGAGDECLRLVGRRLEEIITRCTDLVARYGGEEFVCVLSSTNLAGAVKVAERLRLEVAEVTIPVEGEGRVAQVTTSLGVAVAVPLQEISPQTLLEEADRKLYQAKAEGRNRVCA